MAVFFFGKYSRGHEVESIVEGAEKFTKKWYNTFD
jgi:hypothetical protein